MPRVENPGFTYKFVPGEIGARDAVTLLLLHGTGGDENDLLELGRELWPGAALLSVRGRVLENGMPRFFRRIAEGVFDLEDLKKRTEELAQFIGFAGENQGVRRERLIAVGYSNGANIAASLLFTQPDALAAAVLFRAMMPFVPEQAPDLRGRSIFIGAGDRDPIVPRGQPEELAELFRNGGATVTLFRHRGGHELGADDVEAAKTWLREIRLPQTKAVDAGH